MARITKEIAEKLLGPVPQDKVFYRYDGKEIPSMPELATALGEMGEDIYNHHSNQAKNDFSTWAREVIGDDKLARDLLKSSSRAAARKAVAARVASLKMRL